MMFDNDSHIMSLADLNSLIRDCGAKVTKVRAERSDSAPGFSSLVSTRERVTHSDRNIVNQLSLLHQRVLR